MTLVRISVNITEVLPLLKSFLTLFWEQRFAKCSPETDVFVGSYQLTVGYTDSSPTSFTITTWDLTHTYKSYYNSTEFLEIHKAPPLLEDDSQETSFKDPSEAEIEMLNKLIKYKDSIVDFPGAYEITVEFRSCGASKTAVESEKLVFRNFRTGSDEESFKFDVRYA